jgi:Na+/proline symporter
MLVERVLVLLYLAACIAIGVLASRVVLGSRDEYWVAGRRIGTLVNAMAIMASLASGGSILGVMGLAYAQGIPTTLALFAGAVIGFPLASILVARPLRRFGRYTITDFLGFRYPSPWVRGLVPALIVVAFTAYIVAQLKAAGIAAQLLLGIPYDTALVIATLVFVLYVSIGGMIAITWTDVVQGAMMLAVVIGTAVAVVWRAGSPLALMREAALAAPELGRFSGHDVASSVGYFLIWATAIPVIPHIVMRVYTARDGRSAQLSLNLAMLAYSAMILAAVLAIVPVGKLGFPGLEDADQVFLMVMQSEFSPLIRGVAVAAVLAAVMSTTDALLLACSSAVAHDWLGGWLARRASAKAQAAIGVGTAWIIGGLALCGALSPPALLSRFYTAGIGLLSAGLFVPTIAGLWWTRANRAGGVASLVAGAGAYVLGLAGALDLGLPPIVVALAASALAMWAGVWIGACDSHELQQRIAALHLEPVLEARRATTREVHS